MKQIFKSIHPKQLFRSKKSKSSSSAKEYGTPNILSSSFGSASNSSMSSTTSSDTSSSTHHHHHHHKAHHSVSLPDSNDSVPIFKFDVVSAFQMIDRDGNGKIDRYELKPLFNKSLTDEELGAMIEEIDRDGDGCITLDELQAVGSIFESTAHEEDELRAAFEFFDTDNDGKISAVELFQGFIKLGDDRCTLEDCRRMIEGVDVNKDGFVCFHDFSRMMDVIPR